MANAEHSLNQALGRAIRQLRKEAELTQQALAERAGISKAKLRRIELGAIDADWATVRYLAYGVGVNLADVFRLMEREVEREELPRRD